MAHGKSDQEGNLLSINQEIAVDGTAENSAVDIVLEAGQISIHHGHLIHGSLPNQSRRRRCGLTLRYIPPYVKQVEENSMRQRWQSILVRGEDQYHNFPSGSLDF